MRWMPKRRWTRIALILLAIVVFPFTGSRLASPWRCVSQFSSDLSQTPPVSHSEDGLRIACYNIAHGRGLADSNWSGGDYAVRSARLDAIAAQIRDSGADVIVLNEVDFESSWSGSVNQAQILAEKAGYPYRIEQRNIDFRVLAWTWRFGNAVLSRYPVKNVQRVQLPGYANWETILAGKKQAVLCDVEVSNTPVRLIAVHLSHRSESLRVQSAEKLVELAQDSPIPVIVAGDLNSTPGGFPKSNRDPGDRNAIEVLDKSTLFHRSPAKAPRDASQFTFHSAKPKSIIDWILSPPDWKFHNYSVHPSRLSDHRMIVTDVEPNSEK